MTTVDSEKTKQVDAGKPDRSIDAATRGTALYLLCKSFLDKENKHGN